MPRVFGGPSRTRRATLVVVPLPVHDRVGLAPERRRALEAVLAAQHILQDVVRWRMPASVVVQDEYTHDVVVPWDGGLWLAYDTT